MAKLRLWDPFMFMLRVFCLDRESLILLVRPPEACAFVAGWFGDLLLEGTIPLLKGHKRVTFWGVVAPCRRPLRLMQGCHQEAAPCFF